MDEEFGKQPTCDEEAALAVEVEQGLPALAFPVLDHVCLIQDQILPLLAPEHFGILQTSDQLLASVPFRSLLDTDSA